MNAVVFDSEDYALGDVIYGVKSGQWWVQGEKLNPDKHAKLTCLLRGMHGWLQPDFSHQFMVSISPAFLRSLVKTKEG